MILALVSIIVPLYNAEKFIDRCVCSILQQTYNNLELILIDDGSSDGSNIICQRYALNDSRVKIIRQENGGVSRARNKGIDEAQGEWIMFVDADDWIDSRMVEILLYCVETYSADIGIVGFMFEESNRQIQYHICEITCSPKELYTKENVIGIDGIICSPCNKIYRRKLITENKIYFSEGIKFGEDFIFNTLCFAKARRISCLNSPLYHYERSVENSGVKKFYVKYDEYIHEMENALKDLLINLNINDKRAYEFYRSFITARWSYATTLCLESDISKKEKVQILYKWYNGIDEIILKVAMKQSDPLALFSKAIIYNGLSVEVIGKTLNKIIHQRKKAKRLNRFKQLFKEVIR